VARTVTYKGHQIRANAVLVADSEDGEWAPQVSIRLPVSASGREQPLHDPDDRIFPSQEDAEGYAVHMAMRWVDHHGL
jgi:hypothetical protein